MVDLQTLYHDGLVTIEFIDGAADNETKSGTGGDVLVYENVCFILVAGTSEAANVTFKAQQDTVSTFGSAADLAGTAQTVAAAADADDIGILDIHNPQERYVRAVAVVPNVTTPVPVCCVAIRYGAKEKPTSGNSGEFHAAPAEGTA